MTNEVILDDSENFRLTNFVTSFKNSKKIQKNIKFDLQGYFNIEIMFNGSDRSFGLLICRYDVEARELWCFHKHRSSTLYIYIYLGE